RGRAATVGHRDDVVAHDRHGRSRRLAAFEVRDGAPCRIGLQLAVRVYVAIQLRSARENGRALHLMRMTSREKLHLLVDELSDEEAEAALARLVRERELLARWTEPEDANSAEDAWALANAREALREEPL